MPTFTVPHRFHGPPAIANGGYICGLIAAIAARPVTVRLLRPAPVDVELEAAEIGANIEVRHRAEPIAEARPGGVPGSSVPAAPSVAAAVEASRRYAGFARHPAPTCFVCGPRRLYGDGLCIFPGEIDAQYEAAAARIVAAPWTPDPSLDAGDGAAAAEFVWAALDCPGYVAIAADMRSMLLGELTAEIARRPLIGEPCAVVGWALGGSGRKHEAGTALFDSLGELLARARAVWIEPRAA